MEKKFEIKLLGEAFEFIKSQSEKIQDKIFYNIRKSQILNDPKLFKKLNRNIWEFRTKYAGLQYRILALLGQREQRNHSGLWYTWICEKDRQSKSSRN